MRLAKLPKGMDNPANNGEASTPQWLFDRCNQLALEACGEPLTLDVAAAQWNHKCERYYTEADDGLAKEWDAKAVFCNPPYTADIIEMFVRKAVQAVRHGTTTVMLIPSWNYRYLDLCEQHGRIHRICGPVTFKRQDGSPLTLNNGIFTSSLVAVVFGPTIQPRCNTPISKSPAPPSDGITVDDVLSPASDMGKVGSTALAIQGGGDHPPRLLANPELQDTETRPLCANGFMSVLRMLASLPRRFSTHVRAVAT